MGAARFPFGTATFGAGSAGVVESAISRPRFASVFGVAPISGAGAARAFVLEALRLAALAGDALSGMANFGGSVSVASSFSAPLFPRVAISGAAALRISRRAIRGAAVEAESCICNFG